MEVGGGLPMRARYAQGMPVIAHDGTPGLGPLKNGNPPPVSLRNLRIVLVDGRRAYDKVRIGRDVFRRVSDMDIDSQASQAPCVVALQHIRPCYDEPRTGEHLGARRHGYPADPYQMPPFAEFVVLQKGCHWFPPLSFS
jgi:hypothetical protein